MSAHSARRASLLLEQISDMAKSALDIDGIVDRVSVELRTLIDQELNTEERADYGRRIASGESVMTILKDFARRDL